MTREELLKSRFPTQNVAQLVAMPLADLHACYDVCRDIYEIHGSPGVTYKRFDMVEAILEARARYLWRARARASGEIGHRDGKGQDRAS